MRFQTRRDNHISLKTTGFATFSARIVWDEERSMDVAYVPDCADEDNGNSTARLIADALNFYYAHAPSLFQEPLFQNRFKPRTAEAGQVDEDTGSTTPVPSVKLL